MKAMVLEAPGGLGRIKLVETAPPPSPASDEVTVRVRASCLNYHDYGVAAGRSPTADGRILLTDGAGIVEAVGSGVVEFAPGEAAVSCVFPQWQSGSPQVSDFSQTPGDGVDGFACELVTAPARAFTHAPAGYSSAEAATLPTAGVTAWRALMVNGPLKAGEIVLIQGTGGVSLFALQIAKAAGAAVIATSSSDEKLARLRALGADHLINYRNEPEWGRLAHQWTSGKGIDHVIDVGGPTTLAQSLEAVKVGGHIAMIGLLGGLSVDLPIIPILAKQIRLQGCLDGSRQDQIDLVDFLGAHEIRPILDRSFALDKLADAFRYEESGAHFGKIVIEI
ncbi:MULTISPECIES: NAD(P)-dependent alcohol dehydrogenase [Rhodopseudomonas]|uniref:NADPH:quinone oxidoreductase n=1 Tax=Rhodopseudomonas palustris TaxID=1076 RepID=A0A0D7F0X2_RHOPL|nr:MULTISPECIES: NAD(P)-dependent alcohol dehydrogenase [Rhodopseudomonas]KIZ45352.1 NADPH:quinone oxidoreductase [Rhodopseudomonas palustris]MDF3809346.1 NAD(P)-dependent alcohol dehydrogenase [Rhodopseudomonas sp. BAL398]WOK16981.1 NAD(P)-dependent alcohol dehydrogenase [Rhodopseudomonas sp. BAL398]